MSTQSFSPQSNTFGRTVTATSQLIVPVIVPTPLAATTQASLYDYRFVVLGTVPVYVTFSAVGATSPTASIPGDGANSVGAMIEPNVTRHFLLPYGTQIAVVASGVGSSVYVCIGTGGLV